MQTEWEKLPWRSVGCDDDPTNFMRADVEDDLFKFYAIALRDDDKTFSAFVKACGGKLRYVLINGRRYAVLAVSIPHDNKAGSAQQRTDRQQQFGEPERSGPQHSLF